MALGLALNFDPNLGEVGDLDMRNGPRLVGGAEAARGALYYRFSTFAGTSRADPGEWSYDYLYGVPYRQAILGRYFQTDEIQAVLADVASSTTGVGPVSPDQVSLIVDPTTRRADVRIVDVPLLASGGSLDPVFVPLGNP